jgi:DNA-binding transcriptional LysR family regulator
MILINFSDGELTMELRNLITFIHVAELGSFTKTAEHLGYSQSTVSFQIKQLEDELGCLLFERINHTIALTERGRELVSYAHRIRALTDEFKDNLENNTECSGHIHVMTPDSVCEDMIHRNYLDFHKKYPSISLKYTTADTTEMFEMLDRNEADIIMTLDSHVYQRDYVIAKEQSLTMHFVASSHSPIAARRRLSIKDLICEPFVLTEQGQGYRRVLDKELAKRSLEIVPILEIGRTDLIMSVLAGSDMISFLPDFVTKEKVEAGELCYLDVRDFNISIYKQLIYHKNKWMSKCLRAFIDYVKTYEFKDEEGA